MQHKQKAKFHDSFTKFNVQNPCKDNAVRTMATSVTHSTFTPAATAPLHTDCPMLRYRRENSRVAKLRYAVKFEFNVVRAYMNFKLNWGGSPSKKTQCETECASDSASHSHVLLIYFRISFQDVRDDRVCAVPNNDLIQPGGGGG